VHHHVILFSKVFVGCLLASGCCQPSLMSAGHCHMPVTFVTETSPNIFFKARCLLCSLCSNCLCQWSYLDFIVLLILIAHSWSLL